MTDKQIIIDVCPYQGECSVSGCKRNDDGCFVRQLFEERYRAENQIVDLNKMVEAKEQECERLKESNIGLNKDWEEKKNQAYEIACKNSKLKEQLDQLKLDNKHLNGLLDQALKELEEMRELKDTESLQACILTRENERLKELLAQDQCFQDRSHKCVKSFYIDARYKQALEKIKEICTKYKEICANCEGDEYIDCVDCTEGGEAQVAIKVLQICDEVNDVK